MKILTTGFIACLLLATSVPALADRGERHFRPDRHDRHFNKQIRHFHKHDRHIDKHARYYYQPHHGHGPNLGGLGIGLAVGSVMLALEAPRPPRVVVVAAPPVRPPVQMWHYCESSRTYYPYVQYCPEGWRAVSPW
ncbi:MAG: hypothetical protein QMD17_10350 [Rhodocyclaceae bacterium]|nr:hypothetical protein [Rhodocyclaceae bacterium]